MADPTRQRTLAVLRGHELTVSELVDVLGQPQSTVSRHLKTLRTAGLIIDRRDGSTVHYGLAGPGGDGDAGGLRARLLDWVAEQPIPHPIRTRLRRVLAQRREMSDRFFSRLGRRWDALREESFGRTFHLEALLALLPASWWVLDVGTGTGYLLPVLARQFERVVGIDPVDEMVTIARQRVAAHGLENCTVRRGDVASLPVADSSVDVAIAMLVLHHVPSVRDAFAELHRVVAVGGYCLIVEQAAHGHGAFLDRMQDRWWGFDPSELAALAASARFGDVYDRVLHTEPSVSDVPELFVVVGRKVDGDAPAAT